MVRIPKFYRADRKYLTILGKSGSGGRFCLFCKKMGVLVKYGNPGPGAGARPGEVYIILLRATNKKMGL